MDKDLKKLLKEAERQGFTWRLTRKGHVQVSDPQGAICAVAAGTASDHRSQRNFLSQMRRAGFTYPPK